MAHLFDSLAVRGVTLRNRIGVSPMCQYSSVDGFATDWHLVHLGSRAVGGAALVVLEATAVEARGRISPQDLGIWSDAHVERLSRIAAFLKAHGAVPGIQLAHAGRKASRRRPWEPEGEVTEANGGWEPVAPSAVPFAPGWRVPQALGLDDIATVQQAFVAAVKRAMAAGLRVDSSCTPRTAICRTASTRRCRTREPTHTAARSTTGSGSLSSRCAVSGVSGRLIVRWPCDCHPRTGRRAAGRSRIRWRFRSVLRHEGADLIDCSSGGNVAGARIPIGSGTRCRLPNACAVRRASLTASVGLITSPAQADEIIRNGRADLGHAGARRVARSGLARPCGRRHCASRRWCRLSICGRGMGQMWHLR